MNPGDPSGHGRYGILEDDGERVLCHECGRWYRSVGAHLPGAHGMTPRAYRTKHGLLLSLSLVSASWSAKASASARARGWERLEETRDPLAASAARDGEGLTAGSRRRYWMERDRRAQAAGYSDLADALDQTAAMSNVEAAAALGVPESTLRRWRRMSR